MDVQLIDRRRYKKLEEKVWFIEIGNKLRKISKFSTDFKISLEWINLDLDFKY